MNRKSLFLLILTVIIAVGFYRFIGWDFNWSLFVSSLWNVQPGWLTASIAATLLTYVARAFRWKVLLNPLKSIRRSEEHTSELQSQSNLVCRLLLEKKKK